MGLPQFLIPEHPILMGKEYVFSTKNMLFLPQKEYVWFGQRKKVRKRIFFHFKIQLSSLLGNYSNIKTKKYIQNIMKSSG